MIGEVVTHYRILEKIGEGGMGVVYRGEDTRLGRQVAVKFLSGDLSTDAAAIERFQREARAASALNHPHICAIYDVGQHNGLPFLVMELLDGTTLRKRINKKPLHIETLLEFAMQTADALDAAHSRGIVHRDIKSANLFVTGRDQIKVLDFGLAKLAERRLETTDDSAATMLADGRSPHATAAGEALGTLSSMSPEQARGDDIDARSDIFSFGTVLYEMATGHDPFTGKTSALTFNAILNETPVPVTSLNPALPAEIDRIVAKSLEKDRTLRYQTIADLRADLKRLSRETGASQLTPVSYPSAKTAAIKPAGAPARRTLLLAGIAVVLALGAAGYFFRGWGTSGLDSVAVLPFASTGSTADTEYLPDGLTETLINNLTQLPGLRVSARSVVFKFKNKDVDAQQIGKELNVRSVVTGRVSVRGDRLVIQAELMNVADGSQLWGDQYNRPVSDLLAVQDEIAGEILDKIQPRLSGAERKRVTKRHTDDPVAYQAYLQGRYHWNKGTIAGYKKAIEYFQQAIAKDPNYALAYAGLADSYLLLGSYWVEAVTEAKSAADQALKIDPNLAEAHVAQGHIKLLLDWDWSAAEREFTQGISLNPSSALAHSQYALCLATLGRLPDAIAEVRRAQELDPLSPIVNADLGWYLLYGGQTAEAIAQFRKTLEFDTNTVAAHRGLGIALSQDGRHDEAIEHLKQALTLSENSPVMMGHLGAAYAAAGRRADADRTLQDMEHEATRQYVPSSAMAMVFAARGDKPRALDLLEKAYDEHDFAIAQVGIAPWFKTLRDDPRYGKLIARLGLPR